MVFEMGWDDTPTPLVSIHPFIYSTEKRGVPNITKKWRQIYGRNTD
jgi:hypothetical protein